MSAAKPSQSQFEELCLLSDQSDDHEKTVLHQDDGDDDGVVCVFQFYIPGTTATAFVIAESEASALDNLRKNSSFCRKGVASKWTCANFIAINRIPHVVCAVEGGILVVRSDGASITELM
jgi:hypothetical protein